MQFISGAENSKAILEFFSKDEPLKCAVAFWGGASLEIFDGLNQKIKILCNLESGATNPEAIRKLQKRKNTEIRTLSNLHAKVYLTSDLAIVGSANVSANGLAFEDEELRGWIEASVLITETVQPKEVDNWFEHYWDIANEINEDALKSAEDVWSQRRHRRHFLKIQQAGTSLLEQLKVNPHEFKDRKLFLVMYRSHLSKEGYATLQKVRGEIEARKAARKVGCYENWSELPEDAFNIDLYFGARGRFSFEGLYQIPESRLIEPFRYDNGEKGEIKLCFKMNSIMGFEISKNDQALLKRKISELWNSKDVVGDDEGRYLSLFKARAILFGKVQ